MIDKNQLNLKVEKIASLFGLTNVDLGSNSAANFEITDGHDDCVLIKGDNLRALTSMLSTQSQKIDFCYIDPPYNTGQEFIYSDNRTGSSTGIWGKHHDWMAFMLPRLIAAQILLTAEGIIAISIDDYEYAQLKILMDAVFGAEKYIATLVICRSKNGKGSKQNVAVNHEYVLLYGKSDKALISGLAETEAKVYEKKDDHGEFTIDGLFRKKGDASLREDRPNMHYPLYYSQDGEVFTENTRTDLAMVLPEDSKGIARRWLWGKEKATAESWKLYASKKGVVYVKNYKSLDKKVKLRSILDSPSYLTDRATTELKGVFGEKVFETPKPVSLIRDLIDCCTSENATVLDFFAGTGTTAEAAWELNRRDNSKRRVILVEQLHPIKEKHVAKANGFSYTSELTEFRLESIKQRDPTFEYSTHTMTT